jgi:ABC-type sulfate transport system permease component
MVELVESVDERVAQTEADVAAAKTDTVVTSLIVSALAFLLGGSLAWVVSRGIVRGVRQV